MRIPLVPENEQERLKALQSYDILDSVPETAFDDIVRLSSDICEVPIALVSLVDKERQWFKSAVGLRASETPRDVSFCGHAILHDEIFAVRDASQDERFADNPLVTAYPGVRFYAGAPLRTAKGLKLGTLCVIDTVPRVLTPFQQRALRTLSDQVVAQIELRLRIRELGKRESEARSQRDALVRLQRQKDELASLVVHDLKNPLAAIVPNAEYVLESANLSDDEREAVQDIQTSAHTIHGMVMNLLDISRGEEGELTPSWATISLRALLEEVRHAATAAARMRGQAIAVVVSLANDTVRADPDLLRRILENLLDNAMKYGCPAGGTIELEAKSSTDGFVDVSVCDDGAGVPEAFREKIFERYAQLDPGVAAFARTSRGLGLSFCRLAVEAHGGRIWVENRVPVGSAFRVRLPVSPEWGRQASEAIEVTSPSRTLRPRASDPPRRSIRPSMSAPPSTP